MVRGTPASAVAGSVGADLPYPVVVRADLLDSVGQQVAELAPAHAYVIITDENVGKLYARRVVESFAGRKPILLQMQSGERNKSVDSWRDLTDSMLQAKLGRDTTVIALGGGIVGDVAGFVAATYLRGVPVVQVPTTVVAMVDASLGGKTGVNTPYGKNLVGAFHQPAAVLIDPKVLNTLPQAEFRSGLAEVVKHGVIADRYYFDFVAGAAPELMRHAGNSGQIAAVIARSVSIKGNVVSADTREAGLRKILNFGHTIGHAIEHASNYSLLHGEGVAIGMCVEAAIAEQLGLTTEPVAQPLAALLRAIGLPTEVPAFMTGEALLDAAASDKKVRAGELEFALPSGVGSMAGAETGWAVRVPSEVVLQAIEAARGRAS